MSTTGIMIACPRCGVERPVRESMLGRKAQCPRCKHIFTLSSSTPPSRQSSTLPSVGLQVLRKHKFVAMIVGTVAFFLFIALLATSSGRLKERQHPVAENSNFQQKLHKKALLSPNASANHRSPISRKSKASAAFAGNNSGFNNQDFQQTLDWLLELGYVIDVTDGSRNEFKLQKEAEIVNQLLRLLEGEEIIWSIPVDQITASEVQLQTGFTTQYGRTTNPTGLHIGFLSDSMTPNDKRAQGRCGKLVIGQQVSHKEAESLSSGQRLNIRGRICSAFYCVKSENIQIHVNQVRSHNTGNDFARQ